MDLVPMSHWQDTYRGLDAPPKPLPMIAEWLFRVVPSGSGSCLEIGCFPGTYLAVLGQLGYELHGIDTEPRTAQDLPRWLRDDGLSVGTFHVCDFADFVPERQYDIVSSFGFIEHFHDWRSVLQQQAALVRPGGLLIVETPNFAGIVQRAVHQIGNPAHFRMHNPQAMRPTAWVQVLKRCGFEVISKEYLGGLEYGVPRCPRNILQRAFMWAASRTKWRLASMLQTPRSLYSPFCGVIARRVAQHLRSRA